MTVPTVSFTAPVGPADAPLVILGPSLGTSTILWDDVIPLLATDYRVVAWDLPGHGSSAAASDSFTVDELADAVAEGAESLGSGAPVFYAGVSLGGAVGLALALRHPALVRRAAIVASGAQLGDAAGWQERAAQVRAQSTSSVIMGSAQRWFAPDSIARRPELSGRLLHALQDTDDESYALCCQALAAYDVRDALNGIRMPILAVWGEHDGVAPEAKSAEIADGVCNGALVRIDDAAHLPPAEQPEAVAAVLRDFFREAS
ncbi:alpha/beta fold hydrolase [Microbacterium terregens]|uniref:Alpha/beta fold hydrolase n=1 Tax=Microbacterium terregens TaxID=69363 RepID=A0ABV5SVF8_9MICO